MQSNHGLSRTSLLTPLLVGAMATFSAPVQAQTTPVQPTATTPPTTTTAPDSRNQDTSTDKPARSHFYIGPDLSVYLPTSSRVRDRFGKSWFSFGLGIGSIDSASQKGQIRFDFGVTSTERSHGNDRALIIPVGLSYRLGLTQNTNFTPYVGVSADAYLVSIRADEDNVSPSLRGTGGGSGFLGVTLRNQGQFEVRYDALSKVRGFDLSGLSLKAGYRF